MAGRPRLDLSGPIIKTEVILKQSAGLLVYRKTGSNVEVLIARMGGPWFFKKDEGAWTIPKGEYEEKEGPLEAAKREFKEELGKEPPRGDYIELGAINQRNNKKVVAWAVEGSLDVSRITSNTFTVEWPPKSGKKQEFPEIERAEWMSMERAGGLLIQGQAAFLERLAEILGIKFNAD